MSEVRARLEGFASFEKSSEARHLSPLASIRRLLADLGHPERDFQVVHVAGTHGKGLTAAMIAAILSEEGLKTGLYSSPYVLDLREEVRIDGKWICEDELARLAGSVVELTEGYDTPVSRFDLMTATAFLAFSQAGADWAVVETGLGGRLDSTNVTDKALAVITPIDYDHAALLGESLAEIAEHKLGILREGTPVVVARQNDELTAALRRRFDHQRRPVTWSGEIGIRPSRDGRQLLWEDPTAEPHSLPPDWPSRTYLECLRTALASATYLASASGFRNRPTAWVDAALAISLPGRLSILRDVGCKSGTCRFATVVLDGCHSPAAVQACVAQLRDWRIAGYTLILGVSRDKLTQRLRRPLSELCARAIEVICTSFDSPRAAAAPDSAAFLDATAGIRPRRAESAEEALLKASQAPERPLVVAGSLYLLRDVFSLIEL